jgi:hypothetical protein
LGVAEETDEQGFAAGDAGAGHEQRIPVRIKEFLAPLPAGFVAGGVEGDGDGGAIAA